jgi:hypothetical protein
MHFFRVQLPLILIERCKSTCQIVNQGVGFLGFDNYVVYIGFDQFILYLFFEALLYCTLISSSGIFEPKRHGHVVISAKRCNKGRLDLIILV